MTSMRIFFFPCLYVQPAAYIYAFVVHVVLRYIVSSICISQCIYMCIFVNELDKCHIPILFTYLLKNLVTCTFLIVIYSRIIALYSANVSVYTNRR